MKILMVAVCLLVYMVNCVEFDEESINEKRQLRMSMGRGSYGSYRSSYYSSSSSYSKVYTSSNLYFSNGKTY